MAPKTTIFIHSALIFLSFLSPVKNANILAVFSYEGRSHFNVFQPYLEELATRGHQLFVVSHFPRKHPIANYTDIDLKSSEMLHGSVNVIAFEDAEEDQITSTIVLGEWSDKNCEETFEHPNVKKLIQSEEKFDLLITEAFHTDCFLSFAYKFKVPSIAFSSSVLMAWTPDRIGNPDNPSYIPNCYMAANDRMNFGERFINALGNVFHKLYYRCVTDINAHRISTRYFGEDLPPLSRLAANTSIIFVNTHFSISRPYPLVPGVVEVAGIHITAPRKLPKDLDEFLSGAEHGVIYFSMGSMIRAETLPAEKRDAFLQAFAQLPQRVLWKWESDEMPGRPANVKIAKWLPQFDVLNHPNIRVFLAHGGLLGTIEAVHVGVPMVGIPMYGDQATNIKMVEAAGMGVLLQYSDITKDNVLKALKTVLDNPSYMENAKRTSRAFRDRPMSPMDTAIYWTEYVIRHRGAPHLRTAGADLPLYQYLLLDVIAVLLAGVLVTLFVAYCAVKKLLSLVCGGSKPATKKKQQ